MRTATNLLKILFIVIFAIGFTNDPNNSIGKVSFLLGNPGDVKILTEGFRYWSDAQIFSQVFTGDQIKTTAESRCEVKLQDQSVIRIGENSSFCLKGNEDRISDDSKLSFGRIWLNIRSMFKKDQFTIKTPTAVCSIRGTIFRMEADSTTRIAVYNGSVDVGPNTISQQDPGEQPQNQGKSLKPYEVPGPHEIPPPFEVTLDQWIQIVQGYQIEIRNDGKYAKSKINEEIDQQSEWVKWNMNRDNTNE